MHCGNSCLQDRSCEIVHESRCAIEQESRYSSLGHLHQKKKKKREHELSVHLCWIMCSHTLVNTTGPKKFYSPGIISSSKGTRDSGMSLGWTVLDSTSAFSMVTESMPQGASGCRDLYWSGRDAAGPWVRLMGCDGRAWLTAWALGGDTLLVLGFEKIMPSSSSLNPVVKSDEWVVIEKT